MKTLNMIINAKDKLSHINPEIYGHFSEHLGRCIYKGMFVGEASDIPNTDGVRNDIIEAFRQIKMPVLRWPGGCFADEYHWRDGIGPKDSRKKMINTNWGGVTEDNSFGTHEFFNMCEKIGAQPYLAGNLGSGSVEELADWIEYVTSGDDSPLSREREKNGRKEPWKLKYLGIGNENWGCGGNMRPEYYADEYRRYQSFCKNFSGNELFKVACGPNADDYNWTEKLLESVKDYHTKAISLHYYTIPTGNWSHKGDAVMFDDAEYYNTIRGTLRIEEMIKKHQGIIERYSDNIKLIVDEWGCWYDVMEGTNPGFLYQQNTIRDAIIAAVNLNIFNNHTDIVCMANLAQAVNVLQSLILTEGSKMIKTPTYHVFDMFKTHQNAELVYSYIDNESVEGLPAISKSVSVGEEGMTITLANVSLSEDYKIDINTIGYDGKTAEAKLLSGEVHEHNTFDEPDKVIPVSASVLEYNGTISVVVPHNSVLSILVK